MSDNQYIDIVFDGPPSHESGRFVEVENEDGHSISVGDWIDREDGFWALRMKVHPGLDNMAARIHDISDAHGFWPHYHEEKQALSFLVDAAKDSSMADPKVIQQAAALLQPLFKSRNFSEMLMLAVSELSEAQEADRDGTPPVFFKIELDPLQAMSKESGAILNRLGEWREASLIHEEPIDIPMTDADWEVLVKDGIAKPEGSAVEIIDAIIRGLDTLHDLLKDTPWTINKVADMKIRYNASRPHKHGRSY